MPPWAAGCPELTPNQPPEEQEARLVRGADREGASGAGRAGGGAGPGPSSAHVGLRDNGADGGTRVSGGGRSHRRGRRSPGRDLKD